MGRPRYNLIVKMMKMTFAAAFLAVASVAGATSSDDAFGAIASDINESVAKIVAAQAKRSREAKPDPKTTTCTPAQIDAAYAALPVCEATIKKAFGITLRDFKGVIIKGFSRDAGLVLLTTTDAYFYHEDCDICAAVERCSLKDGSLSNFKTAHSVDCGDLAPLLKKNVAYSACPLKP